MPDPNEHFQKALNAAVDSCDAIAQEVFGASTPRNWMFPPLRGWSGDPLDIPNMRDPFERSEPDLQVQDNYLGSETTTGSVGEAAGASMQVSYMGMLERSFRGRHSTSVRAAMHSTGRRLAHSSPLGVHIGVSGVLGFIQDMLNSGSPPP